MLIWGKQKEVNVFYTQGAGQVKVGCDFIPQEEKLFFFTITDESQKCGSKTRGLIL